MQVFYKFWPYHHSQNHFHSFNIPLSDFTFFFKPLTIQNYTFFNSIIQIKLNSFVSQVSVNFYCYLCILIIKSVIISIDPNNISQQNYMNSISSISDKQWLSTWIPHYKLYNKSVLFHLQMSFTTETQNNTEQLMHINSVQLSSFGLIFLFIVGAGPI